jgi:AmmeMemoRadiSam system protein B
MSARQPYSKTRPAAVAGSFYPSGQKELGRVVESLLAKANSSRRPRLHGIVAPHAGYMYSGPVAANAFAPLPASANAFERVLLLGPPHYVPVSGIVAPSAAAFATPLGEVEVDRDTIAGLVETGLVGIDDRAHAPEHALEVELPFLQVVLGRFDIVPLLVGDAFPEETAIVIEAVLNEHTLLVVSTDLSHYLDYASAQARDLATAEAIERFDFDRLGPYEACGFAALNGALCAGRQRRWHTERLDLRNSGDTGGDKSRVVGYGAWVFLGP